MGMLQKPIEQISDAEFVREMRIFVQNIHTYKRRWFLRNIRAYFSTKERAEQIIKKLSLSVDKTQTFADFIKGKKIIYMNGLPVSVEQAQKWANEDLARR